MMLNTVKKKKNKDTAVPLTLGLTTWASMPIAGWLQADAHMVSTNKPVADTQKLSVLRYIKQQDGIEINVV